MTTIDTPDDAPAPPRGPRKNKGKHSKLFLALGAVVILGVAVMAVIGFALSYDTLYHLAITMGDFSPEAARWVPIGIDAGIIVFLAFDLLMAFLGYRFSLLRYTAWALTGVTIYANGSAVTKPVGVLMHIVMPILFVMGIEAARHVIVRLTELEKGQTTEPPPLSRWLLAFRSTYTIWRRMKLWDLPKYSVVLEQEQGRQIFDAEMREKHGKHWKKNTKFAHQALLMELSKCGKSIQDVEDMLQKKKEAAKKAEKAEQDEEKARAEAEQEKEEKKAREKRAVAAQEKEDEQRRQIRMAEELAASQRRQREAELELQGKQEGIERARQEAWDDAEDKRVRRDHEFKTEDEERRRVAALEAQRLTLAQQQQARADAQAQAPVPPPATRQAPVPPQAPATEQAPVIPQAPVPPPVTPAGNGQAADDREAQAKLREDAVWEAGTLLMGLPESVRHESRSFPKTGQSFADAYGKSKEWGQKRVQDARRLLKEDESFARECDRRANGGTEQETEQEDGPKLKRVV